MDEPQQEARTLAEAYVLLDLLIGRAGSVERARPVEGADGWRVDLDGHRVAVPYAGELAARKAGAVFGLGRSAVIDAGQWALIGAAFARRALEEDLLGGAGRAGGQRYASVVDGWRLAAAALEEALKFVPEGAAEVPGSGFWTEMGREALRADLDRFTRVRLAADVAFYRDNLDDFTRLHAD